MDIISVFGGIKTYHRDLLMVSNLVNSTMSELGLTPKEINLGPPTTIPFYDGIKSNLAAEYIEAIRNSAGVIFFTTASAVGLSAILTVFLEHLASEPDVLQDKNCMLVIVSDTNDSTIMDSFAKSITRMGGYDSVRVLLDHFFFTSASHTEMVEKQIEDFYRMVRQKRKFYMPSTRVVAEPLQAQTQAPQVSPQPKPFTPEVYEAPQMPRPEPQAPVYTSEQVYHNVYGAQANTGQPPVAPPQPQVTAPIPQAPAYPPLNDMQSQGVSYVPSGNTYPPREQIDLGAQPIPPKPTRLSPAQSHMPPANTHNLNDIFSNFNQTQNNDIQEISSFFSRKQTPPAPAQPSLDPLMPSIPTHTSGQKNIRQLTASLIHFYQPQVAGDLACTIQINIDGPNAFVGHLIINHNDCHYLDGPASDPTLTILSDETNWLGVVTGKISAQKAFMTGSLKIKGNFVLLTRFDQLFNTSKNI